MIYHIHPFPDENPQAYSEQLIFKYKVQTQTVCPATFRECSHSERLRLADAIFLTRVFTD